MKKMISLILTISLVLGLAACGGSAASGSAPAESVPAESTPAESIPAESAGAAPAARPTQDPSGAEIALPDEINTIAVLAPSIAETIVALGYGDKIVVCDTNSAALQGVPADIPALDLMEPDMEQLAALLPDVLFVSSLTLYDQESPYQQLMDLGVCVVCVPTSDSLADIESDVAFIAAALNETEKGEALIADMQAVIDRIAAIGATITDKKTVYFEISPAPYMYSFGSGVFLNEMIELIGAENILADQEGWLSVEPETVVAANPDVILTNVNYTDDPVGEILAREGWDGVAAVASEQVYAIDNLASSLPNQNVVIALEQMAQAIYPDAYAAS